MHDAVLSFGEQELLHDQQVIRQCGIDDGANLTLKARELEQRWIIPPQDIVQQEQVLGRGGFGEVREAIWQGHVRIAVKHLTFLRPELDYVSEEQRKATLDEFYHECRINSQLHHPNIVQFYGVVLEQATPLLALELMAGGPLTRVLYQLCNATPAQLRSILADVCGALVYLHSRQPPILHLDIKPTNILMDQHGRAKLADLGVSHVARSTRGRNLQNVGTVAYTAPEMFMEQEPKSDRTDMFSFGVTMCEVISGRPPNPGALQKRDPNNPRLVHFVSEPVRRQSDMDRIQDPSIKTIVQHLLQDEMQNRWSAAQTLEALLLPVV
jgi:serine/threonine protein kinase